MPVENEHIEGDTDMGANPFKILMSAEPSLFDGNLR